MCIRDRRYALTRAFAYGQGPSQTAAEARDGLNVGRWMIIGVAQTLVWGAAALVLTLLGRDSRAVMADRAARGLGKVLWMKNFEPRFYGQSELDRLNRQRAPS